MTITTSDGSDHCCSGHGLDADGLCLRRPYHRTAVPERQERPRRQVRGVPRKGRGQAGRQCGCRGVRRRDREVRCGLRRRLGQDRGQGDRRRRHLRERRLRRGPARLRLRLFHRDRRRGRQRRISARHQHLRRGSVGLSERGRDLPGRVRHGLRRPRDLGAGSGVRQQCPGRPAKIATRRCSAARPARRRPAERSRTGRSIAARTASSTPAPAIFAATAPSKAARLAIRRRSATQRAAPPPARRGPMARSPAAPPACWTRAAAPRPARSRGSLLRERRYSWTR